jgi:hypothetical protein
VARFKIHFSQQLNIFGVNDVSQTEIRTTEPLVPESIAFEFEIAIKNLKRNKTPGIDQILAEAIKAGRRKIRYVIYKLINYIWNKNILPEDWKDSIIVPIYKKDNTTDCSNYRCVTLLSSTYRILPNILRSSLTPYAEEIKWYLQRGFRCKRSTTDHIFRIRQILTYLLTYLLHGAKSFLRS